MIKILVIKLGAKGDVVRTLSILPALKEKFQNSEIYWLTKKENISLFDNNPYIRKVLAPGKLEEEFDILYNFDIEKEACNLALETKAKKKLGFFIENGNLASFNLGAEYYLSTIFDDELKKSNKKTYQEMMFQLAELEWKKQTCEIFLAEKENKYAEKFMEKNNLENKTILGIHMGAGSRWPSKAWHKDNLREFIIKSSKYYSIILFGGPNEAEEQEFFCNELEKLGINICRNNPNNSDREFLSLVHICNAMICPDSFSLHASLALKKRTVGLFFCTSPDEVEGYELLRKIVSPLLSKFFPQRCDLYDEELVKSISAEEVLKALRSL